MFSVFSGIIAKKKKTPECPWITQGFLVIQAVFNSGLSAALPNHMNPTLVRKYFAFSCAILSAIVISRFANDVIRT